MTSQQHKRLIFDCETNGLLDELTKIHCIGIECIDTGRTWTFVRPNGKMMDEALSMLSEADLIVGHNIVSFDIPALQKVYPGWKPRGLVRDTFILTSLIWPHIKDSDFTNAAKGTFPKKLIGAQSLEAWGYRLGNRKGDYDGGWEVCTPAMLEYMMQDVSTTATLWARIVKELEKWKIDPLDPNPPPGKDCVVLEHRVAEICTWIEKHGWPFDEKAAIALIAKLTARQHELAGLLEIAFPPKPNVITPKASNKKLGYVKGQPFTKYIRFNPASRQQIAERLMELGWKPQAFGMDGVPTVDDDILQNLPYPQAKLLAEYFVVDKRLGQIANGKQSWLKHLRNGRIHGRIISGGAHTGRMTHSRPNVAQVPGNGAPYGEECRACWTADKGYVMVGADADALELRDLAGYMARYDGGAYIETVLRGDKAQGTDMHTINAKAIGCSRDVAKVFFYAMIYGSGDYNLGLILGVRGSRQTIALAGKSAKRRLMIAIPALGKLLEAVKKAVERGYIVGLDGRHLKARAENAALNTLLQSAGALQMKRGLVILVDALAGKGWEFGREYALLGLIHDEWQASVKPKLADEYGEAAVQAIRDAGAYYGFRCPLDGQYKKGATWKDTH